MRYVFAAAVAAAVAFLLPNSAAARKAIAILPPAQRAVMADTVVVGKVAGFEKNTVTAASPYVGATDKVEYQIATIKVETGLIGAEKVKEIKVGFLAPPKPGAGGGRPVRGGGRFGFEPKEGQELVLFLVKHPTADFHVVPGMVMPIDTKDEGAKDAVAAVKAVAATLADPAKALKADKPEARAEAATAIVLKYRNHPVTGAETEQKAIAAEESKVLLKALAEGNWATNDRRFDGPPSPLQAFQSLGLTDMDGWVEPVIVNAPGAPPVDYGAVQKDAFLKWLDGPGKNYVVKKLVPKAGK